MAPAFPDDKTAKGPGVDADQRKEQADKDGKFRRQSSSFRDVISADHSKFKPEKGRYVVYVVATCPWAHRALLMRKLKGLEEFIDVVWLHWALGEKGWYFKEEDNSLAKDPYYGYTLLREFYFKADPRYDKRFTVPMLWDRKYETIVNNESSEIIRIFNTAFNEQLPPEKAVIDVYPEELLTEIDEVNEWVYDKVNNGVYKTGFATTQEAYDETVYPLFESLERLDKRLSDGREFIMGSKLTEVDIRLYPTIVRFDAAYFTLFRCNIKMIRYGYPYLHKWLLHLYYDFPEIFEGTTFLEQLKKGYASTRVGITPAGPIPLIMERQAAL
ncbi:glutathione S-transferase [Lipomyces chichibuensis]|uniref:glutathione S-transferase n=1 Tax=Lipomyces chichibuensis TaxID=1546026 RepID=UPI0033431F89